LNNSIQVQRPIPRPYPALVFPKHNVKHPMLLILYRPAPADIFQKFLRSKIPARYILPVGLHRSFAFFRPKGPVLFSKKVNADALVRQTGSIDGRPIFE
jgi:hypothetical protein